MKFLSIFGVTIILILAVSLPLMSAAGFAPYATPTALILPTQAVETLDVTPASPPTLPPPGEKIGESEHFEYYAENGYFPVDLATFQQQAEQAYADVSAQLNADSRYKILVAFRPPSTDECPARGMAFVSAPPPQVFILADENTPEYFLLGVISHEAAHSIHAFGFSPNLSIHTALNEGLATWAARAYWNVWQGSDSLEASVRNYLENETYLPLHENYEMRLAYNGADCLTFRDILYTEWASFVGWLMETYGVPKFKELLLSSPVERVPMENNNGHVQVITRPPDYEGIYGLALNQLEAMWLRRIRELASG